MEIRHYVTASGNDPYQEWLDNLNDLKGRVIIQRRIDRIAVGNLGDHKFCQGGVWELRIDFGPGYRVYYARDEGTICFCFAVDRNALSPAISSKRFVIGKITSGEKNETQVEIDRIP